MINIMNILNSMEWIDHNHMTVIIYLVASSFSSTRLFPDVSRPIGLSFIFLYILLPDYILALYRQ